MTNPPGERSSGPAAARRSQATPRTECVVLLVEDTSPLRTAIRIILTGAGYVVIEARDGYDATMLWQRHRDRIDLVLTDLRMPQLSGRDLATILEADRPELPIIFMSGDSDEAGLELDSDAWGRIVLQKPFLPAELLRTIASVLGETR